MHKIMIQVMVYKIDPLPIHIHTLIFTKSEYFGGISYLSLIETNHCNCGTTNLNPSYPLSSGDLKNTTDCSSKHTEQRILPEVTSVVTEYGIAYSYSAYLLLLQNSKHYLTHLDCASTTKVPK